VKEDQHLLPLLLLLVVVALVEAATEVMESVLMEHAVQGYVNLRIQYSESLLSVKVVHLLSLVTFSMDGVGQHQTTALAEEDQHLLPILL
jgi:hypothetical protein